MKPILLIEDDDNDVLFMRDALHKVGLRETTQVLANGQEGINYFNGSGRFANRERHPLPCLVLLDLNLPVVNGFEFLHWLRSQPAFKAIVVIVLTSSGAEQDVYHAYSLGANSYVLKPSDPLKLAELAELIKTFWFGWNVVLPACAEPAEAVVRC